MRPYATSVWGLIHLCGSGWLTQSRYRHQTRTLEWPHQPRTPLDTPVGTRKARSVSGLKLLVYQAWSYHAIETPLDTPVGTRKARSVSGLKLFLPRDRNTAGYTCWDTLHNINMCASRLCVSASGCVWVRQWVWNNACVCAFANPLVYTLLCVRDIYYYM
jgi:hypothetical protein